MSKKFLISEEDRSYIISLYNEKGIVLNEQTKYDVDASGGLKSGNITLKRAENMGEKEFTVGSGKGSYVDKYKAFTGSKQAIIGASNKDMLGKLMYDINKIIEKNKSKVESLLSDENSKTNWNEILNDESQRPLAADVCVKARDTKNPPTKIVIVRGSDIVTPGETITGKTEYPSVVVYTPKNFDTSEWFENNQYTLNQKGMEQINQLFIQPLIDSKKDAIAKNSKVKVNYCLQSIKIDSSCSRFVNTGDAKDLTFEQLAYKRAESANTYLREQIKNLGVTIGCQTPALPESQINYKGSNNDGSSGPNPPKGYKIPNSGKEGDYNNDESKRNQYGAPLEGADKGGQKSYAQFRYTKISAEFGVDVIYPPSEDIEIKTLPGDKTPQYTVKYFKNDIQYKQWSLKWNFVLPKTQHNNVKSGGKIECPSFNNGGSSPSMTSRLPGPNG